MTVVRRSFTSTGVVSPVMAQQVTVVCDDELGRKVVALAREYDTTEEEIARQLIEYGIECLD